MTTLFKPIRPKKLSEEIVEQIKTLITDGQLKPGEKIPSEREMAALLGVSRPSVREAIMVLETMGLLESRQGGGTYVRSLTDGTLAPLAAMMEENPELLGELLEVRMGLECWAAYLAAKRATEAEIREIGASVEEMASQAQSGGWSSEVDSRFHYAITTATHNTMQLHVLNTIHGLFLATIEVALTKLYSQPRYIEVLLGQHRAIYEAIAARDGDRARRAMADHLEWVQATLPRLA
ncbi:MAG: FadR family transcriptional regulator [Desulfurivibrio sp.]|nr:MAG: FadR family transcriptional regulator [Desulfurivibrio sp.]